jgi:hypothetical protein
VDLRFYPTHLTYPTHPTDLTYLTYPTYPTHPTDLTYLTDPTHLTYPPIFTTPILASVSPFLSDGTARMNMMIPGSGATTSCSGRFR